MPSFVNFPPPNLPLSGAESLMIAQAQNGQLVTCTATISEIGAGAIGGALSSPPPIGNVTPNTGAFTALNAQTVTISGNETVDGTLNVVGNTTLNNLTVEGTFTTPVPILPAQAANTFFAGPMSGGAEPPAFRDIASVDINAALTTPGPIGSGSPNTGKFTTVSASGEIAANGAGTGLDVVNNAVIGGTLSVTGNSALSTVTASGEITANGSGTGLDVVNNAAVGGALTVSGEINATGSGTGLAITNNATVGGNLTVTGTSTLQGAVSATASGTGLAVTNNATIGGAISVTGTSFLGVVSASGLISANGSGTGLSVTNNAGIGGTFEVSGVSTFAGEIVSTASGTGLSVTNNSTIGGTLAVTGTVSVGAATAGTQAPQSQQTIGGAGTSYVNVTSSRALNTTFTNSTGAPIFVISQVTFSAVSEAAGPLVNGVQLSLISNGGLAMDVSISFVVPNGDTYEIGSSGAGALTTWFELGI